jgi:hypothetical protein
MRAVAQPCFEIHILLHFLIFNLIFLPKTVVIKVFPDMAVLPEIEPMVPH